MLKKILLKIQKLEQQKQVKLDKQAAIQTEIDDLDAKLKNYIHLKRIMRNCKTILRTF